MTYGHSYTTDYTDSPYMREYEQQPDTRQASTYQAAANTNVPQNLPTVPVPQTQTNNKPANLPLMLMFHLV